MSYIDIPLSFLVAAQYWHGKEVLADNWEQLVKSSYLPSTLLDELFSGILNLVLSILRIPENKFSSDSVSKELIQLGYMSHYTVQSNVPSYRS